MHKFSIALFGVLSIVAVGCSNGSGDTSLRCVNTATGLVCQSLETSDQGDGASEGADADAVCEDSGCVEVCKETDSGTRCVTECEGGLRCVSECATAEGEEAEANCSTACTCPEAEGDKPPAEEGDKPPAEEGDKPPAEEGDKPPAEEGGDEAPPADEGGGEEPPPADGQ